MYFESGSRHPFRIFFKKVLIEVPEKVPVDAEILEKPSFKGACRSEGSRAVERVYKRFFWPRYKVSGTIAQPLRGPAENEALPRKMPIAETSEGRIKVAVSFLRCRGDCSDRFGDKPRLREDILEGDVGRTENLVGQNLQ